MYIAFYITARLDKSLLKNHYILLSGVIFICAAFCLEMDNPWYGSTLCFWLGIFYYIKKEAFLKFFLKHTLLKVLACSILLALACILFFIQEGILGNLIARNCASMIFVFLVHFYRNDFLFLQMKRGTYKSAQSFVVCL